jgi:hypothetical protein
LENDFQRLLRQILAEHFPGKGGQKRLAGKIGIDPSRLSRAVRVGDYTFNLENCLRLATAGKRSPLDVLEAAGKHEEALLLKLSGFGSSDLLPGEAELISLWRQLESEDRPDFVKQLERVARLREQLRALTQADGPRTAEPRRETRVRAGRRTRPR